MKKKLKKPLQITSLQAPSRRERLEKKPLELAFVSTGQKPVEFTRTRVKVEKNGVHIGPWEVARAEELFAEPEGLDRVIKIVAPGLLSNGVHVGPALNSEGVKQAKEPIFVKKRK